MGLTGLAFLPLVTLPTSRLTESDPGYHDRAPWRSLAAPVVVVFVFATLPESFWRFSFLAGDIHFDSRLDLSEPDILGAPCSAVTGAASLSSYVDSPVYAALQHAQSGPLAVPQLAHCASSGRPGGSGQLGTLRLRLSH